MNNDIDSEYIKYLPAIYQQEEVKGKPNILSELLKIFEKILSGRDDQFSSSLSLEDSEFLKSIKGIDEVLDNIHDYFDLLYAPEEFIPWLTNWIALTINEDWSQQKKRRLRSEIVSLYKIRGTLKALERYLKIYTLDTGQVQVSEVVDFRIGDNAGLMIQSQIGLNTKIGSTSPYFFEVFISLPEPDPFILDFRRREVLDIIELEKPAYTYYGLRVQVGTMQIGADTLHSVHFYDINTGWAVGVGGIILHTSNGGNSWNIQESGVNENLYSVHFFDDKIGWAVGDGGIILHTNNSGENWITQQSGVNSGLLSVDFHDDSRGWAVGMEGIILHTTDGGVNWNTQNSGETKTLFGVSFPRSRRGWAVGEDGIILGTTNAGSSWSSQNSGVSETLRSVYFRNSLRGWVVGNGGIILSTIDGGNVWNAQNSGVTETIHSVNFRNNNRGWTVGDNGIILSTVNGGTNWNDLNSGVSSNLFDVLFLNINVGWVVGQGGVILHTTNRGLNWNVYRSPKRLGHSTIGNDTLLGTLM